MTSQTREITESPIPIGAGRVPGTSAATAAYSATADADARDRDGGLVGFVAKTVAVAFWGGFLAVVVGFAVAPVLFLLPVLGFGYAVIVLIALTADRNVE